MPNTLHESTVDAEKNNFFTKHKELWWDLNSPVRMLHQADNLVLNYVADKLLKKGLLNSDGFRMTEEVKVLDVGCGGGILAEPLARAGAIVVGIDSNKEAIEAAQEHARLEPCLGNRIVYKWEKIEDHCLNNVEEYDIVLLSFVLQHAQRHDVLLRSCVQTLKPGGAIFISSFAKTYTAWFRTIVLGEQVFRCYPRGLFNWNNFISSSDVEIYLKKSKCHVGDIKGFSFDYFTSWWKCVDSVNVAYMMHAIKQ